MNDHTSLLEERLQNLLDLATTRTPERDTTAGEAVTVDVSYPSYVLDEDE